MKIETLNKGIAIKDEISGCQQDIELLRKFYKRKNELTAPEIETLFNIADKGITYKEQRLKRDLENL